jgi:hypothetical protein
MLVQVPAVASHAQRRLIALIEKRQFTHEVRTVYGLSDAFLSRLHSVAVGKMRPSYGVIFQLREHIAPVSWYYAETEKLPKRKLFTAKYTTYNLAVMRELSTKPIVAHTIFEMLREARKLTEFCVLRNINAAKIRNCTTMNKRKDGIKGYTNRPSYPIVKQLRGIIHPDLWYVFPDEITKPEKTTVRELLS